jgi:hypothetical protein
VRRSQTVFLGAPTLALSGAGLVPRIGTILRLGAASIGLTGSGLVPRIGSTASLGGGSLSLTGAALNPIVTVLAHYTDDFNRANSTTTLGANWTNRSGTMGINTNAAYNPVTSSLNISYATYNSVMVGDDMQCAITIGTVNTTFQNVFVLLGCNTSGEGVRLLINDAGNAIIASMTVWGTVTTQATSSSTVSATAGDVFMLKRVGNVYTGYKNGVAIGGLSWTDSGNLVPRDSSHRVVGIAATSNVAGTYTRIDAWSADG